MPYLKNKEEFSLFKVLNKIIQKNKIYTMWKLLIILGSNTESGLNVKSKWHKNLTILYTNLKFIT